MSERAWLVDYDPPHTQYTHRSHACPMPARSAVCNNSSRASGLSSLGADYEPHHLTALLHVWCAHWHRLAQY